MAERASLRVEMNDGVLTLGTLGPVCIYLYRDAMTLAHIAKGRALHRALYKKHPEGLGVLIAYRTTNYLGGDANQEARNELVALIREASESVKATAVAIESTGFVGAAIRASATGLTLIARPRFALKYTATARAGAEWLSEQLGRTRAGSADELMSALSAMERAPAGVTGPV